MKLIRFFVIFLLLLLAAIIGVWYYVTSYVASELNNQYAKQKFAVKSVNKEDYFISFDEVKPDGFPFKVSWSVQGWSEESRGAKIAYTSPVKFGYNLLSQKAFVEYDGEIIASYKPLKHGFGSKLKVNNYFISVALPISGDLISMFKNKEDPIGLINHIGKINVSTDKVEIFDLVDDEKFYDKEYEDLRLSFTPKKKYTDLKDLMENIPQQYDIDYIVKMNPMKARARRLPVSLFYGFSLMPSGVDMAVSAKIKTAGNNMETIRKGLEVKADVTCESTYVNLPNFVLDYKAGNDLKGRDYSLATSSKLRFKEGMFDELFKHYKTIVAPQVQTSSVGKMVDKEAQYIIANRELFKFKDLENNDYDFNLKMGSSYAHNKLYTKIEDFSIFSKESGIKLKHDMESSSGINANWLANGVFYIRNYPSVVDFTSGYIYRFGKFRFLSEEARRLYVDVNTKFLKEISDHPKSTSNDISFEYSLDSRNLKKAKIGSVRADAVPQLYSLMLYRNLLAKVGSDGDVLAKMQKIIPGIDPKEPMLQQILPKITNNKEIEKKLQKHLDKAVPKEAQDLIKKILPKGKINTKDLFKNFTK